MQITKTSGLTGVTHTREIDVSESQMIRWHNGGLIQDELSHLSADDREFLITGSTPEEWADVFGEESEA